MVLDFGRSEYKLDDAQLVQLAAKVRSGDLTDILKAWEKDIQKPLRSAVSGNLIQCLLIQIQKGKVDVAIAMDGIQKMVSRAFSFSTMIEKRGRGLIPSVMNHAVTLATTYVWIRRSGAFLNCSIGVNSMAQNFLQPRRREEERARNEAQKLVHDEVKSFPSSLLPPSSSGAQK